MISLLVLIFLLVIAAIVVRVLRNSWLKNGRRNFMWFGYLISLVAIAASFYVVKSGIVPRSAFSVLLVFGAVVYFSIQGYLILKAEQRSK